MKENPEKDPPTLPLTAKLNWRLGIAAVLGVLVVLVIAVFVIGITCFYRAELAPNRIVGKWMDDAGEIWEFRQDGSLLTTDPRYPIHSYGWNVKPTHIHLYYGAHKQSPMGPFRVSLEGSTLTLEPAWKYLSAHGAQRSYHVFRRLE